MYEESPRCPQADTVNYSPLRNAESGRNSLPQRVPQLVIQYQMVSPENIHTNDFIQVVFMHLGIYTYTYTYMLITTVPPSAPASGCCSSKWGLLSEMVAPQHLLSLQPSQELSMVVHCLSSVRGNYGAVQGGNTFLPQPRAFWCKMKLGIPARATP